MSDTSEFWCSSNTLQTSRKGKGKRGKRRRKEETCSCRNCQRTKREDGKKDKERKERPGLNFWQGLLPLLLLLPQRLQSRDFFYFFKGGVDAMFGAMSFGIENTVGSSNF